MDATPVDALYRENGVDFQTATATLGEVVEKAAALPLLAQPGAAWNSTALPPTWSGIWWR